MSSAADVSVIFETENEGPRHRIRLVDVLAAWRSQTRADRVAEWIFVSPRDPGPAEQALMSDVPHRWVRRPDLRYYEQKNAGLAEARTPYAALSDSDAAPDPRWLEAALDVLDSSPPEVAAVTGRSRFLPGPFSRELELAEWPHIRNAPYDCEQFLAHNALLRVEPVRDLLFGGARIRHGAENALARALVRTGRRIRYDPGPLMTHNYARRIRELWLHAAVRGFSYATFDAHEGRQRVGVLRDAVGRFRVLARRLVATGSHFGIRPARYPLSLAFFAWYCAAVGSGYARALRGEAEPLAEF